MIDQEIKALCDTIRNTAYSIHEYHGHGHLENVYENALFHRLNKSGFTVKRHYPIVVHDEDGTIIGEYFADLLAENMIIIELKAVRTLTPEHEAQILGYLKSGRTKHGLLINFGSYRFQIRKFVFSEYPQTESQQYENL